MYMLSIIQQQLKQLKLEQLKQGERRWLGNIQGSIGSLLLSEWIKQQQGLMLIVAQNSSHLKQLEDELHFYRVQTFVFPDWEILPYDRLSPHRDIISERLQLLMNIPKQGVVLITVQNLLQRVCPVNWLLGQHFNIKIGDVLDLTQMRDRLIQAGYHAVDTVYEHGEFAIRGSLIDIFATGQEQAIRIELFDQEVESLRYFDIETQRTTEKIEQFIVLPAKEFPLKDGRNIFRERYAKIFPDYNAKRHFIYQDVMEGNASSGIEYYLPLFFSESEWESSQFLDYFTDHILIVTPQSIDKEIDQFWEEIQKRYEDRSHDIADPIVPPELLYIEKNKLLQKLNMYPRLMIDFQPLDENKAGVVNLTALTPPTLTVRLKDENPYLALDTFIHNQKQPVLIVIESASRYENIKAHLKLNEHAEIRYFQEYLNTQQSILMMKGRLDRGLQLEGSICIVTETQLYEQGLIQQARSQKRRGRTEDFVIRSLTELSIGEPVVHIDHGIGRYAGLVCLEIDKQEQEFIQINYAEDAKVYVPVTHLKSISQYRGGDASTAPLHKIGNDTWKKSKQKALEKIYDVAAELIHTNARRQIQEGISYEIDWSDYHQFASQFAYEETADQARAIQETLYDLQQKRPMDRLICGDVGFGKTEIAMRASYVTIQNGYQVVLLVPTTLLAQQHYETFQNRFAGTGARIEVLSRIVSHKAQEQIIEDIYLGQVDIVIGTQQLLQEKIKYKNLGLLIVDEEHRFGVRDKERIKTIRANINLLTLTATPIPRTLNMAFMGMRELSIISTAPSMRLAVKTIIQEQKDSIVKEAILRELLRGGQVYYIHNEIETMARCVEKLHEMLPDAKIGTVHGQMREAELEYVMQQFYHKRYHILVSTTIIETGIDNPNSNTIIIERADKLGLAQLHQLRGRVGRSHHQAYAYLLVPSLKYLKGDAKKRLDAIQKANTLGAGFMLAREDLEIRGVGELLGEQQSGSIQTIGYNLYMEMLEKATKSIQQGKHVNLDDSLSITSDINLHLSALIPHDYLADVHQRLLMYKRISNANNIEELNHIRIELVDRFGSYPQAVKNLFAVHRIRVQAEQLAISKIDIHAQGGCIEFKPDTPVEALTIIQLIQQNPTLYKMEDGQRLRVKIKTEQAEQRIMMVENILKQLL